MMPLTLTLTNVSKSYGDEKILSDLSYTFGAGETHILMGANGCGKSTLLRICALLERPDSGSRLFSSGNGELHLDLELRRRITLVLPKVGIFNDTVFNNLAYGLKIRVIAKDERAERVTKMLKFIGLEHKKNQNALTLSSGEAQRLSIGRALVIEPDLLLLDEPTASIDNKNRELIEAIILQMKEAGHTTIIMTTHDSSQAGRLSSRLVMMRNGKLGLAQQHQAQR
jgi:tungstate transport system ATP-binding protein